MAWNRRWQALPNRWRSCVSFTVRGALPGDPVSITNMTDAPEHASEPEHASILHRTAAGAVWLIGWRMCTRGLGIVSTLVLVRLLLPEDFGLVALATGFWQAIDAFSGLGVEEALIREKVPSRALYDTGFTINMLRGLLTVGVIVAGARPVGWFFGEPRLVPVVFSLAIVAFANGCENIGIVDFRRHMDFRQEFIMLVFPRVVSMLATIGAAIVLESYWALIIGIVLSAVLRVAGGYVLHPYRPRLGLSEWRVIAGFSFWSWALSVTTLLRDRVDNFIVGRLLGMTPVGIYAISSEIAALPTTELVAPLGRACFSAFAHARNAGSDVAHTYLRLIGTAALIGLPAGFGISLVAGPVVKLAFGDRWEGAVRLIEILGATSTVTIFGTLSTELLTAYAALKPQFWVQVSAILLRIAAIAGFAARFGLTGAAIGMSLSLIIENLWYTALALRHLRLRAVDLLTHTWRGVLATLGMAGGLVFLGLGWTTVTGPGVEVAGALCTAVAAGAAIYGALLLLIWLVAGRPAGAERDVWMLLRRMLRFPGRRARGGG